MRTFICFFGLILSFSLFASGKPLRKKVEIGEFEEIFFKGSGEVNMYPSENTEFTVEAEPIALDGISVRKHRKRLIVRCKSQKNCSSPTFNIGYKTVKKIFFHSSGVLQIDGLKEKNFLLDGKGSGKIYLNMDLENFAGNLSEQTKLFMNGTVKKQRVFLKHNALYKAIETISDDCKLKVYGSAKAYVQAQKNLDIYINGDGRVYYTGQPLRLTEIVCGSGKLIQQ